MPLLYSDMIYAAVTNAMRGLTPQTSPNLDADEIAESLVPQVFQAVGERVAADERKRPLLRRQKTVTLTAGEATLDDDVLVRYITDGTLWNQTSLLQRYSWCEVNQFIRDRERRLGLFTVPHGNTLWVRDPGELYASPLTATGDRILEVPCVPVKPAAPDDPIDVPEQIASDLVEVLSEALRVRLSRAEATSIGETAGTT